MVNIQRALSRFWKSGSGNIATITAFAVMAIAVSAGAALDYSRIHSARSQLAGSLDSALIAAALELIAQDMTDEEAKAYLTNFLNANLAANGFNHTVTLDEFDINWTAEEISATAKVDLPMTLMKAAGVNELPVSVNASSVFGATETEVAMTFDVTGSMSGNKIAALKTAALTGIDELLSVNTKSRDRLRISVVPYADAVNVGSLIQGKFEKPNQKLPDGCRTERPGKFQYTDDGPDKGPSFRDSRLGFCPSAVLQPLTSDPDLLKDSVNQLSASGYTAGHIGIQWAWFTISPNWAPYFPLEASPGEYKAELNKFAVIMTDGQFNTAFAGVPNNKNVRKQQNKSMVNALKLCANMKAKGIKVFTVGFALKNKSAIDTMRACASPDAPEVRYYHAAGTGSELVDVYKRIGQQIKVVRLGH